MVRFRPIKNGLIRLILWRRGPESNRCIKVLADLCREQVSANDYNAQVDPVPADVPAVAGRWAPFQDGNWGLWIPETVSDLAIGCPGGAPSKRVAGDEL